MTYSSDRRQPASGVVQSVARPAGAASFIDQRSSTAAQMQLKQKIDGSQSAGTPSPIAQLMPEEEEPLQGKFEAAQRQAFDEEEEPVQAKFARSEAAQLAENEEARPNNTGLPDNLKSGIENLSGMSMDHVKVHYNSAQPAQLNAHAYAQGSEIHMAPGQEQHLPHEAWHVVQQAQGRVRPTVQMKGGVAMNDDAGLESEADGMGEKAAQFEGSQVARNFAPEESTEGGLTQRVAGSSEQKKVDDESDDAGELEASHNRPLIPLRMEQTRPAAAASSEERKEDDMRDLEPHRWAWAKEASRLHDFDEQEEDDDGNDGDGEQEPVYHALPVPSSQAYDRPAAAASSEQRQVDAGSDSGFRRYARAAKASRKHKRVDDSEDDTSVADSEQEGGESDEEFIVQTPKKGPKKKNPMSMIKADTRRETQGRLEYETLGGAKHLETPLDRNRTTETTGLTYSNEFRNPAHRPADGYTVYNHYGLSKGQQSRNQMVVSHNSPSWAGMQAGSQYGNSSLTSPAYNSAIEKKERDWRETLKNSSATFSYKTETEYENVSVEDAPAIYKNLQQLPYKNARWSQKRIGDRLRRVVERHPESKRVSEETRELRRDDAKRVFTLGRDYRAFLPARAYDQSAHKQYLVVRPEDSEGSDKELEPPEELAKKKGKTKKQKK